MKKEIIDKMRPYGTGCERTWFGDFECDKGSLVMYCGPFIWVTTKWSTTLIKLGYDALRCFEDNEATLFYFVRSENIFYVPKIHEGGHILFYDGNKFSEITQEEAERITMCFSGSFMCWLMEKHREIYDWSLQGLPLKVSPDSEEYLERKLSECKDGSLRFALDVLCSSKRRTAIDEYVYIAKDRFAAGLYFEVRANGKCRLNGGLFGDENGNHWTMHT